MNKLNLVSCVSWVRHGVAKEIPKKLQLTQEEIQLKIDQNQQKLKDLGGEMKNGDDENGIDDEMEVDERPQGERDEIIDRYNLDDYDNEEVNDIALNHSELAVFADNREDPLLNEEDDDDTDEEIERDDFRIKPTDNLLLVGHIEEDSISLEVKIYNQADFYVHHEIYLSAYPISFQWLDFQNQDEKVNFVAIGDMEKDIHIWDLDTVDAIDSVSTLTGHTDSVLDLSWSEKRRNILASSSADKSCFFWDLEHEKCVQKFDFFKSNVQSIDFHPLEPQILLAGDCNGRASIINSQSDSIKKFKICKAEIEKVVWNRFNPFHFLCATSTGYVYKIDCRNENGHLFAVKAHQDMISGMEMSCDGCLVTSSSDKVIKVWDINQNEPKLLKEFDPKIGVILSLAANPNYPFIFAASGDSLAEHLKVFDISKFDGVRNHFNVSA